MVTPTSFESFSRSELRFERLAVLAVSSMAEVELCRVVDGEPRGQLVAVKRLPEDLIDDEERRNMFRDEIWMAAALDHENVARVLSWGADDRGPYLVSEFVQGVALSRLMRTVFTTGEAFSERLCVYLAAKVSAGLASAHALRGPNGEFLNLVHRDLTPGNILVGFDGSVKITDFGLAKAKQRITHTQVGFTKGTPAYMSPEQVLGKQLDGRSDVFALGMVMYELFAHRLPFEVRTVKDALMKIVKGPDPDIAEHSPRIDKALIALINRCLKKPRDERYENVHLLKADLDKWLELHGYVDTVDHLARFVRRNAMRQMRWLDRAVRGDLKAEQLFGPYDNRDDDLGSEPEVSPPGGARYGLGEERSATSIESPQGNSGETSPPRVGLPSSAAPPTSLAPTGYTPSAPRAAVPPAAGHLPPPLPTDAQTTRAPLARSHPAPTTAPSPGTSSPAPAIPPPVPPPAMPGGQPQTVTKRASLAPVEAPTVRGPKSQAPLPPRREARSEKPPRPRRARAETATVVAHRPRDGQHPLGADGSAAVGVSSVDPSSGNSITTHQALAPDLRRALEEIHEQAVESSRRSRSAAEEASGAARVAEAAARRARDEGERADAMQRAVQRAAEAVELHLNGDLRGARAALHEARELTRHAMTDEPHLDGRR